MGCLNDFFSLFQMKATQCDKNHPEKQQLIYYQQALLSCCVYVAPSPHLWLRAFASSCWKLQSSRTQVENVTAGIVNVTIQRYWVLYGRFTWKCLLDYPPENINITGPKDAWQMHGDRQSHVFRASLNQGSFWDCLFWRRGGSGGTLSLSTTTWKKVGMMWESASSPR